MKLWLISQKENIGYDTYDSAIVAAETEEAARNTHPCKYHEFGDNWGGTWAESPKQVRARLIGGAAPGTEAGVILASFNAG